MVILADFNSSAGNAWTIPALSSMTSTSVSVQLSSTENCFMASPLPLPSPQTVLPEISVPGITLSLIYFHLPNFLTLPEPPDLPHEDLTSLVLFAVPYSPQFLWTFVLVFGSRITVSPALSILRLLRCFGFDSPKSGQ